MVCCPDLDAIVPLRSDARHAFIDASLVRPDGLAAPGQARGAPEGELLLRPLQLIFHAIGWYLLYEEDPVGREPGLRRVELAASGHRG